MTPKLACVEHVVSFTVSVNTLQICSSAMFTSSSSTVHDCIRFILFFHCASVSTRRLGVPMLDDK